MVLSSPSPITKKPLGYSRTYLNLTILICILVPLVPLSSLRERLFASGLGLLLTVFWLCSPVSYNDDLPIVNRYWALEPNIFSRWRWAYNSENILKDAYLRYKGQPYLLARGDVDIVILPDEFIGELNKMPQSAISSKKIHSLSMIGHLNGLRLVDNTRHLFRLLLTRGTPALSQLLPSIMSGVEKATDSMAPYDTHTWTKVQPMKQIVRSVGQAITLISLGPSTVDDPEAARRCSDHSTNAFAIMFIMRLVPTFLQPILVWLTPYKWRLEQGWKRLEASVLSETQNRRMRSDSDCKSQDLLSWIMEQTKSEKDVDVHTLTRVVGTVFGAGIWSTAAFSTSLLFDLAAHPHFLSEIRQEIKDTHERIGGSWDASAFNSLEKLDSAMKETLRLSPGTMLVFSRNIEEPITLSNGLHLHPGQTVSTSGRSRSLDPEVFPNPRQYDALRSYNEDLQKHRMQPFRSIEGPDHRWGVGRWSCPGRNFAALVSKVILVKLLDEFDFTFEKDKNGTFKIPSAPSMHEFIFMSPDSTMLVRRRKEKCGIAY